MTYGYVCRIDADVRWAASTAIVSAMRHSVAAMELRLSKTPGREDLRETDQNWSKQEKKFRQYINHKAANAHVRAERASG